MENNADFWKQKVEKILSAVNICVNRGMDGDIIVHNPGFYKRVLAQGSLGLGESYMDGWWECERLDTFFYKILKAGLQERRGFHWKTLLTGVLPALIFNLQSSKRAFIVGEQHYDIGNDIYRAMLDKRMTYTCAYWPGRDHLRFAYANFLDQAQEHKLELVCQKIGLKKRDQVLDVGCGWGSFAKYAAEKYGAEVVGITISKEQVELAKALCAGLPVDIWLADYREVSGQKFDHIVSLGMFEHVGYKNYRTFMQIMSESLRGDGLFLLQTIGSNRTVFSTDPWINKHIFPNGMLPSIKQIGSAIEGLFVMEDWHNFSTDYDKTLLAWYGKFIESWPQLKLYYDERFFRMWTYYLLSCAGSFRARHNQLWQIVFSKKRSGGYLSIR